MVKTKVLVVTGASGGHIFPALSLIARLEDNPEDIDTLLVLPRKNIESQIIPGSCRVEYLPVSTVKMECSFENLVGIFNFLKSFCKSIFILAEFRPSVVVGFGTLTCIPMVFGAWFFRIRTIIHEQNVLPGRANRLLAGCADKIAVSFPQTKGYLKAYEAKVIFTGNPIKRELKRYPRKEARDFFGLDDNRLTILVMGGSQGSHRINNAFLAALGNIKALDRLQIIHLSGKEDYSLLRDSYTNMEVDVRLFGFLKEMQFAYSAADLAISRSGATTIAELVYFALPAILIPYPFAYRHQLFNARALESYRVAVVIEDGVLGKSGLGKAIASLLGDPLRLSSMRDSYKNISRTQADNLLAQEVLSLSCI
jgi:UDP-N-acetylglucosamine--N-acetylmuramyl-(pentapeptide) pyrophosphoryl-undecaprenol N-acetylglucosamine transferase